MQSIFGCCFPQKDDKHDGGSRVTFNPETKTQPAAAPPPSPTPADAQAGGAVYQRPNKRKGTAFVAKQQIPEDEDDEDEDGGGGTRDGSNQSPTSSPPPRAPSSRTAINFQGKRGRKGTGVPPKDVMKQIEAELAAIELKDDEAATAHVTVKQHNNDHYDHGILHDPSSPKSKQPPPHKHPDHIAFNKQTAVIGTSAKSPTDFTKGDINPSDFLKKAVSKP